MSLGIQEITLILIVILLLFGGKRIPELAKAFGRASYEFKKAKETIKKEAEEIENEVKDKLNELLEKGVPFPSRNDAFYEIVAEELSDYYNGKTDTAPLF